MTEGNFTEEERIVNIYIGFIFDIDCYYTPLIVTTDFDRCKEQLLKKIDDEGCSYWGDYYIEVWSNEERINNLVYDKGEKCFVSTIDF